MIWLIGNKGMLGTELSVQLEENKFPFIGSGRETDITDVNALREFVRRNNSIRWIINCAAYTSVEKAEDDKETCHLINIEGSRNIASVANEIGAVIIHISTDYVFNGRAVRPYTEEDETDPIGIYGLSKRYGEIKVLEENEKAYIIRTAWLYGKYGNNFVHTMLHLMRERDSISVVDDQKGSPTWAFDLAKVILEFIKQSSEGKIIPYGIYNFTNEGEITWFDFAGEIYRIGRASGILTKNCEINSCASDEFPARVNRPVYSVLDKTKIKNTLGIKIPVWNESLRNLLYN